MIEASLHNQSNSDSKFSAIVKLVNPRSGLWVFTIACVCALLYAQIKPLLWKRPFYVDWTNNVWLVEYYRNYFTSHYHFPAFINAQGGFGNPMPLFYGFLLYPLMATLSLAVGADGAVRLMCALLFLFAMLSMFIISYYACGNALYAAVISTIANSSVYQMTNLYARSAVSEFCAEQFLVIGLCWLAMSFLSRSTLRIVSSCFGSACMCLALGSHPITAYLFAMAMVPLVPACILVAFQAGRNAVLPLALSLIGVPLMLFPWIYNVIKFRKLLHISSFGQSGAQMNYFPSTIDSAIAKLDPIGIDGRVLYEGIARTSTPFLEAPIPLMLVLLTAYLSVMAVRRVSFWTVLSSIPGTLAVLSVCYLSFPQPKNEMFWSKGNALALLKKIDDFARTSLAPIQFAYRLTNTITILLVALSILLLCMFYFSGKKMAGSKFDDRLILTLMFCATISMLVKYNHTRIEYILFPKYFIQSDRSLDDPHILRGEGTLGTILTQKYWREIAESGAYPQRFTAIGDYSMPKLYAAHSDGTNVDIHLNVQQPDVAEPLDCASICSVETDVVATSFSQVFVDGQEYARPEISDRGFLVLQLPSGHHDILVHLRGRSRWAAEITQLISVVWVTLSGIIVVVALVLRVARSFASRIRNNEHVKITL